MSFEYRSSKILTLFGEGRSNELSSLLRKRSPVLLHATFRNHLLAGRIMRDLVPARVGHFSEIAPHVPESLVEKAQRRMLEISPEIIIALGGGSCI